MWCILAPALAQAHPLPCATADTDGRVRAVEAAVGFETGKGSLSPASGDAVQALACLLLQLRPGRTGYPVNS